MKFFFSLPVFVATTALSMPVSAQITQSGQVTSFTPPARTTMQAGIDYKNAQAMPLPRTAIAPVNSPTAAQDFRYLIPAFEPGGAGTGQQMPVQLFEPSNNVIETPTVDPRAPQEHGTRNRVFTTSLVNASNLQTSAYYPYRAAGKLFFQKVAGGGTFVCSASLIKPGIVVTAAHCLVEYGQSRAYTNWQFVPAYNNGQAPYGVYTAKRIIFMTGYYTGSQVCNVVCSNDIGLIEIYTPGVQPGNLTGWFGYGWNGYGQNPAGNMLISQLGYPVALDGGQLMERTDSQSSIGATAANNLIGSLQTGGSSGGPWLVNLGMTPTLSGGPSPGTYAAHNTVVGVTSWGYGSSSDIAGYALKELGASPFTSNNIVALMNHACSTAPGKC